MDLKFFLKKAERIKNDKNVEAATLKLYDELVNSSFYKDLVKVEQKSVLKNVFNEEAQDVLINYKKAGFESDKGLKDVFYNFFGMHENWPAGRNLTGCFLVGLPEYPAYFLPAYTQSKTTGDAKELRKGEGTRGLITGCLEGIAVGALVSGRKVNFRGLLPYVALGMSMQFFSSKVFPYIGEKAGQHVYKRNQAMHPNPDNPIMKPPLIVDNQALAKPQPPFGTYQRQNMSKPNNGLRI